MKKICTLFMLLLFAISPMYAKSDEQNVPEYELTGATATPAQGTYVVTVSILSKKNNVTDDQLARAAVHGVLFQGFSTKDGRGMQRPLAGSRTVEAEHAEYFNSFFKPGGAAAKYAEEVKGARQVMKVGKQYKITTTVTVMKDQLVKDLEEAGVIRGLNSIF